MIKQIRCLSAEASEEDGNHTTRPLHLHLLRQEHSQASLSRDLEVQVLQEDCRWWSIHHVVSARKMNLRTYPQAVAANEHSLIRPPPQNTRGCGHKIDDSTIEGDCRSLDVEHGHMAFPIIHKHDSHIASQNVFCADIRLRKVESTNCSRK